MASEWKNHGSNNIALWDKGYTWGLVTDLSKLDRGLTGYEAELQDGKYGSRGLKKFAKLDAAKAYVERSTAPKRDAHAARATDSDRRARLHAVLDAVMDGATWP